MPANTPLPPAIDIVLATDENYVQHTGVVLLSLFQSYTGEQPVRINLIGDGLCSKSRAQLASCLPDGKRAKIEFININSAEAFSFRKVGHISKMMYARLVTANLLPNSVERILYLDTDTIVRHCIGELWKTDLHGNIIAAVEEVGFYKKVAHKKKIGLQEKSKYMNSGVLLIDLNAWRENEITQKLTRFMERNPNLPFPDQDALNVVLEDKWLPLPPKWNVHKDTYNRYYSFSRRKHSAETVAAIKDPAIMHFTGPTKPWRYASGVPFSHEYIELIAKSPWKGFRYPDRTLKSAINRFRWRLRIALFGRLRKAFPQI